MGQLACKKKTSKPKETVSLSCPAKLIVFVSQQIEHDATPQLGAWPQSPRQRGALSQKIRTRPREGLFGPSLWSVVGKTEWGQKMAKKNLIVASGDGELVFFRHLQFGNPGVLKA